MKQYLLLVDDNSKLALESAINGIQFLEVQGINLNNENKIQLLATPVLPQVNQFVPASLNPKPDTNTPAMESSDPAAVQSTGM